MVRGDTLGYVRIEVTYRDGVVESYPSVKLETIEIDEDDYLRFDRLRHEEKPCKFGTVVIDLTDNVRHYEIIDQD